MTLLCTAIRSRDHPRACGAHLACRRTKTRRVGSSPRMRGSRRLSCWPAWLRGIIPAHAGLTVSFCIAPLLDRDHPRACGAHWNQYGYSIAGWGSSPRMRGSPLYALILRFVSGIIPAHAGLTTRHAAAPRASGDHPRACGAHTCPFRHHAGCQGSSPRMRGSLRRGIR